MLSFLIVTSIKGDNTIQDSTHACHITFEDVMNGCSDTKDDSSNSCVVKRIWLNVHHREIIFTN